MTIGFTTTTTTTTTRRRRKKTMLLEKLLVVLTAIGIMIMVMMTILSVQRQAINGPSTFKEAPLPQHRRRRLSQLHKGSSASNDTNPLLSPSSSSSNSDPWKILYIMTSSSMTKGANDRWKDRIVPVILETVESLKQNNFATVDVYLILGYHLPKTLEDELRDILSQNYDSGLEVWTDAAPMTYKCSAWDQPEGKDKTQRWRGDDCATIRKTYGGEFKDATLLPGNAQLARQHRFVVKDKLPYYDFFMAFEDDMLIQQIHVRQHLKLSKTIQELKALSSSSEKVTTLSRRKGEWYAPISTNQVDRLWPGWIRVEVLQENVPDIPPNLNEIDAPNASDIKFDPNLCCSSTKLRSANKHQPLQPQDVMVWEASITGTTVRSLYGARPTNNSTRGEVDWVAILPGPNRPVKGFLAGKDPQAQPSSHASVLAQSAGWMATGSQLLRLHGKLCDGGFLPPFDGFRFPRDGLFKHNVEFYSGGIQMSAGPCSLNRIIPLNDWDKHLLYHSSNNKQSLKRTRKTMIPAQTLLAQLLDTQRRAKQVLTSLPG